MASKGQSLLTHHFNVKKRITVDRNFKTPTTKCRPVSNQATPKAKYHRDDYNDKTPKRKAESSTVVDQVRKKPKVERKNLSRKKISLDFKDKVLSLLALPQKESLTKVETLPNAAKLELKVPAFDKLHSLSPQSKVPSLTLPYKYKVLSAMFESMDRAVSMLYNRKETCTFSKIQKAVQQMTKRNFDLSRLAQIAKVYPECYNFTQEKSTGFMYESVKSGSYYLAISPVMPPNENKLNSALLIERKNNFQERLLDMAKDHHQAYLQRINLVTIDKDQVISWHKNFKVDEVPDVPLAQLPQPPNIPKYPTAKEVIERGVGKFGKKMDAVLENMCKSLSPPSVTAAEQKPQTPLPNPALKGIPQSLIDKIRAKEAAKITMPREECLKIAIQAKLPEICRIMKSYFNVQKKRTMPLEKVMANIGHSLTTSLSFAQINEHIQRLAELVPDWIKLVIDSSNDTYVQMNKDLDFNIIIAKLEAKV